MKKSVTQQLKVAKEEIKRLEKTIENINTDRRKFREEWTSLLKWWIELHGTGKTPSTAYLIERFSKFLTRVDSFYWG